MLLCVQPHLNLCNLPPHYSHLSITHANWVSSRSGDTLRESVLLLLGPNRMPRETTSHRRAEQNTPSRLITAQTPAVSQSPNLLKYRRHSSVVFIQIAHIARLLSGLHSTDARGAVNQTRANARILYLGKRYWLLYIYTCMSKSSFQKWSWIKESRQFLYISSNVTAVEHKLIRNSLRVTMKD